MAEDRLEHLHKRSKQELLDLVRRLVAEPREYESGHSIAAELASNAQRAATRRLVALHAQERTIRRLKKSLARTRTEREAALSLMDAEAVKGIREKWKTIRMLERVTGDV